MGHGYTCILWFAFLLTCISNERQFAFQQYSTLDDQLVLDNLLGSFGTPNFADCARECVERLGCMSFSYNSNRNSCFRYSSIYNLSAPTTVPDQDTRHYTSLVESFLTRDGYMCLVHLRWCYKLYESPKKNVTDAQLYCGSDGGNLTNIDSQAKDDILSIERQKSSQGFFFTGINDRQTEGLFVDIHGNPITYSNWDIGQPNNIGNNQHCMTLVKPTKWDDSKCDKPGSFICDKLW